MKTPRFCDCIRFPRQKTKYYVTDYCSLKPKYLKGYNDFSDRIIWTEKVHGFFYKEDALILSLLAKSFGYKVEAFSITYPDKHRKYLQ